MSTSIEDKRSSGEEVRNALAYARSISDTVREPLVVLDGHLRVQSANRSFYRTFRVTPQGTEGQLLYDLANGQWDIPRLRTLLEEILPQDTSFDDDELEHDFPDIGRKVMLLNARRLRQAGSERILLAIEDVSERRRAGEARHEMETRFASLVKTAITPSEAGFRLVKWVPPESRPRDGNGPGDRVRGPSPGCPDLGLAPKAVAWLLRSIPLPAKSLPGWRSGTERRAWPGAASAGHTEDRPAPIVRP
jgi:PAS domain-containing protein